MATSDHTSIQLPLAIAGATVEIPLTQGYFALVDSVDADLVLQNWHTQRTYKGDCYAISNTRNKGRRALIHMHRVILARVLRRPLLDHEECDHKDLNGLNNRRCNLRLATRRQQGANRGISSNNTSGFKGVCFDKRRGRWRASIHVSGRGIYLGNFLTPEEAHAAYCKAAVEYFGEFARFK